MTSSNGHKPIRGIEEIPDDYLLCRDLGHLWQPSDVRISRRQREIERVLRCHNCSTLRTQVLTLGGYLIPGRSFTRIPEQQDLDADHYVLKGVGRLSVDAWAAIRVMSTQHMNIK